jgi:hypothetical protein
VRGVSVAHKQQAKEKRRPPAPDACAGLVSRRFPWTVQGFSAKHRGPLPWTSREENGETGGKRCRLWGNGGAWKRSRGGLRRPGSASGLEVLCGLSLWLVCVRSIAPGPCPGAASSLDAEQGAAEQDTAHTTPVVSRRSVGVCAAVANTRNADPPAFSPSRGGLFGGVREGHTSAKVEWEWKRMCARSGTPCPDQAWVAEASVSVQRFSSATQEPPERGGTHWSVRAIPEGRHKSETRSRTMQSHNGEDTMQSQSVVL